MPDSLGYGQTVTMSAWVRGRTEAWSTASLRTKRAFEDTVVTVLLLFVTWAYWPNGWEGTGTQWIAVGACLAQLVKRRMPIVSVLIAGTAAAVSFALWPLVFLAWWLVRTQRWVLTALLAALPLALAAYGWLRRSDSFGAFVEPRPIGPLLLAVAAAMLGAWMAERHRVQQLLTERIDFAEQSRESLERDIRTSERLQLASELHDIVAHRLSIVALHAAVLARRTTSDPDLSDRLKMLENNSVMGVRELGDVLLALRSPNGDEAAEPTELRVDELLRDAESTGLSVRGVDEFDAAGHSSAQLLSIKRILREGLTNARKYSSDAVVSVDVVSSATETSIKIGNDFDARSLESGTGTGLGLIGLRERIRLVGGNVGSHVVGERYTLSATVPRSGGSDRTER
ncbi:histidine kinase [Rhodococcus sp. IEGM 1381]|uniref:sensor histidine kinase n=1 Tax=Rhodococcus sp. IEGM 1381 TaxID=3047085 RepID=UPI0024B6D6CE|nr:histidine kinase [Rhodococcus sp. IEGM 1381]MDI9896469.1 histidine kinase [Rhodococcus sp. IEGM 1381]